MARHNDAGFSLLELVVAVSIILILGVGGVVSYQAITHNAHRATIDSTIDPVFTMATAYRDSGTTDHYTTGQNPAFVAASQWMETTDEDYKGIDLRGFMVDQHGQITENPNDHIVIVAVSNKLGFDRDGYPYFKWKTDIPNMDKATMWQLIQQQNALIASGELDPLDTP